MSPLLTGGLVVSALAVATLVWLWSVSSRLERLRSRSRRALGEVLGLLITRGESVPRLVETAKGHLKALELSEVPDACRELVAACEAARTTGRKALPEVTSLNRCNLVLERALAEITEAAAKVEGEHGDPLRSLIDEIGSIEARLGFARASYNDAVRGYNEEIRGFPARLVAASLGFSSASLLVDSGAGSGHDGANRVEQAEL